MEKVKMSTAEEELLKRILTERQEWKPTNIKEQALAEKIIKDLVEISPSARTLSKRKRRLPSIVIRLIRNA